MSDMCACGHAVVCGEGLAIQTCMIVSVLRVHKHMKDTYFMVMNCFAVTCIYTVSVLYLSPSAKGHAYRNSQFNQQPTNSMNKPGIYIGKQANQKLSSTIHNNR